MNQPSRRLPMDILALWLIIAVCLVAGVVALGFPNRARIYPVTASVAAIVVAFVSLRLDRSPHPDAPPFAAAAPYLAALTAYLVAAWLIGLIAASGLFIFLTLGAHARIGWGAALACAVLMDAGLVGLGMWLNLRWPEAVVDLARLAGVI